MEFKSIGDYTLEEIASMTDSERKELERRTLAVEKDYICSGSAIDGGWFDKLSPSDLSELLEDGDEVGNLVLIEPELGDEMYIMTTKDFQTNSRVHEAENRMLTIEYLENGLPSWLFPEKGINYYLAEYDGSKWKFTEYAKI